jgi:predicted transcriptional regulator
MLNTENPNCFIYKSDELLIELLGGVRIDTLDRMRVTIKVAVVNRKHPQYTSVTAGLAVRHNLDLYNDNQVEKFIRTVAERLEIGSIAISKAIADITSQLEVYRLTQLDKTQDRQIKALSAHERNEAIGFLQSKNLLEVTNELIGKSGVIGEAVNRLLMYLIFTSRKREHPLHIISLGSSGAGKTHLQEKVGELIPAEDKLEITVLSENAFYYFGQHELQHRLIMIEDLDGAESVLYPLRELQSKKFITKTLAQKTTTGETKTIHLKVEGPVSVAGCTTQEAVYEDNANRSFLIYIDESAAQDERIMEYQRKRSAGTIDKAAENKVKALLQNTQRILLPREVRNPYAEMLQLPAGVFKPRRTNAHYLAFIEAVTFYHQYQRVERVDEDTGEVFIETTLEDIAAANYLMKGVLLRKSDELTGACRNYFERLKLIVKQDPFTTYDVSRLLRMPISTVNRHNLSLLQNGYLKRQPQEAKAHMYEIVTFEDYQQLQSNITTALDSILQKLTCSPSAHLNGEQVRPMRIKRVKPPAQLLAGKQGRTKK